jgi:hypothetical protein
MSQEIPTTIKSTMAFVFTTYSFDGEHSLWRGPYWECLLTGHFNYKVCFQVFVCVCDREVFSHLFATMSKYQFSSKIQLGFRQYMMVDNSSFEEGNLYEHSCAFLWLPILQLSRHKHKRNVLESKLFLSLVHSMSTPFALERRLYNYEICLKALKTILDIVLQSGMGCLRMYGGGTFIHLCLVSISLKCDYSNIFKCFIQMYSHQVLTSFYILCFKRKSARYLTLVLKMWDK